MKMLVEVRNPPGCNQRKDQRRELLTRLSQCLSQVRTEAIYFGFRNERVAAFQVVDVESLDKPGGRAVVLEFIPNEDRVSPPIAGAFGLQMLVNTPGGDAYTGLELKQMFHGAGFSSVEVRDLPALPHRLAIARN